MTSNTIISFTMITYKKNNLKILIIFLLVISFVSNAQKNELGKVTIAELEEKAHPTEKDAPAAVLFENGETRMEYTEDTGFILVTETEVKIKIYNKEGYKWANKTVGYYVAQNPKEKVSFSKAVTYNLVNGQIEKTKLKSEGEFDEKVNKFWSLRKITMPNIKEGSVIEYKLVIESPYITNFPTWSFQNEIPVNHSQYKTYIPEYFTYNINMKGYLSPKAVKDSKNRNMRFSYTTDDVGGLNSEGAKRVSSDVDFMEYITTYTADNVSALKDESYVNNINNYTASISHELAMTKYPNSPSKNFATTWEGVVKTIYDSDGFGGELRKSGYFETELQSLLAQAKNNNEKLKLIFDHVKQTMNWNNSLGYYCDEGVKKAYKLKTGNIAEINIMLTAMLRAAGLKANPVLVSTRSNGISFFPNRTAYNYVIAAVETDNGTVLLDATDKYALPGIIPVRALNWTGRIIREDGSSTPVNLMPNLNSKEIVNVMATLDNEGKLEGKVRDQYFDYNAFRFRVNYNGTTKDSYLERLEEHYSGIEIDEYTSADKDFSKPVVESYSFKHNNTAEVIGGKIYLPSLLFFRMEENPFKQEKREYPVDFVYPNQDKYAFTINIPEGYVVESIPEPIALGTAGNIGSFKFNISATNKQIQIASTLDINQSIVGPDDYETLKIFYKQVIEKQNEKIVLKKI